MPHESRLVAYAPNGPRLGVLPWPLEWSATTPHLDLGAASLRYSRRVAGGGLLQRRLVDGLEVALEEWDGAAWVEPAGARYIAVERDLDPSDPSDTVTLTLPAYGWVLSKIKHAAPSEALYSTEDGPNKGRRQFLGVNAGVVIKTLRDEYVARGGYTIDLDFDTANDSNGNAWPSLNAFWISRGEALDVTLGRLADGGSVDWWWQGRTLHAAPPAPGRERGSVVILRTGREVAESPSKETIAELISAHTLEGGEGLLVTTDEPTAPTPWGRWEGFASDDRVTVAGSATARNQQVLAEAGRLRGQYTRDLTPLCPHRLGIDVWPGDWITAPTSDPGERVRVASLLWRSNAQGVTRSLILNDSLLDRELRRARKERLGTDGGSNGAGSTVKPAPEGIDKRIPAAPTGLAVTTQAYIDEQGVAQGLISGSWDPVTTVRNEDGGGSVEVESYQFAVRRNVVGAPWAVVVEVDAEEAEHAPLPVGESVQVKVRARGRYSYYLGLWSDVVTLDVASDTEPPPVPSAPVVSARLGVVQVEWDGLAAAGGSGVPDDYARTEVAIGTTTTPTDVRGTILRAGGMAHIADLPYSADYWVRLRSVDLSGNISAWSAAVAVTVTPLVDADLIGSTVNARLAASATNMVVDSQFRESLLHTLRMESSSVGWERLLAAAGGPDGQDVYVVRNGTAGDAYEAYWLKDAGGTAYENLTPVESGRRVLLSVYVNTGAGRPWNWSYRALLKDGTTAQREIVTVTHPAGGLQSHSYEWVIPNDVAKLAFGLQTRPHTETAGCWFALPRAAYMTGSTLIEPGAITAPKLYADLAMANHFAGVIGDFGTTRTNWLEADHIDAGSFRGYVIEGADIKSNNPGDPNNYARMNDRTFTVGRDDGEGSSLVTTQLGGPVSDQLILRDTSGATRAMLDAATGTGSVSGQFSAGDLRVGGDRLADMLYRLPQGILAYIQGHGDSPRAGSSAIVHMRLNANTSTDRMYRLTVDGILAAATAGDRAQVFFRTFEPTTKDLHLGNFVIPTTTGEAATLSFTFPGLHDGPARFALMFRNATANRGVFWSGRVDYPVHFYLEDLGARRFTPGTFDLMGTTPLSGGTNTDSTGPAEYVKEYSAAWTRSWRGGSIVTDFLHHGQWGGIQRYSMVGFDNAQLTSDLSGATLIRAEVLLDNQHWYYGAGGTLRIGSATNTSAPSSPVTSGTVATTSQGYGEQKWAAVGGFTTSSRAITLGVGAGSSLEYYGKQSNSGVRLRLTYRK